MVPTWTDDLLAFEIFRPLDRAVVLLHEHRDEAARIIGVCEVDDLLALIGDVNGRDSHVEALGEHARNETLEVNRGPLDLLAHLLGHGLDEFDVEARQLAVLLEFERHEGRVGRNAQRVRCLRLRDAHTGQCSDDAES